MVHELLGCAAVINFTAPSLKAWDTKQRSRQPSSIVQTPAVKVVRKDAKNDESIAKHPTNASRISWHVNRQVDRTDQTCQKRKLSASKVNIVGGFVPKSHVPVLVQPSWRVQNPNRRYPA